MQARAFFFLLLTSCAHAHERSPGDDAGRPGEPVMLRCAGREWPTAVAGDFTIVPFECRESTRAEVAGWRLSIGPDGGVRLGVPDGPEAVGALACEDDAWVFRGSVRSPDARPLEFALRASAEPRVALALESLDPEHQWAAWAVRDAPSPRVDGIELPELTAACAVRERWELRAEDDLRLLAEGSRLEWERAPVLQLRVWSSSDLVSLWDPAIDRAFAGHATEWTGDEGFAVTTQGAALCSLADGSLRLSRRGERWAARVSWRIVDADDRDGDGDREDGLVRVSEYELDEGACRSAAGP